MAIISADALKRITAEAAKKGISVQQVANVAGTAGISVGAKSSGNVSSSKQVAARQAASNFQPSQITRNNVSTTPQITSSNIFTPTYNKPAPIPQISNSGLPNLYGDVRPDVSGRQTYTGEGVRLSTGEEIKDLSKFGGIKGKQEFDIFGKAAEQADTLTPGFLAKRNDAYALDIRKAMPNITAENADQVILDYIKQRDTNGQLNTTNRGDVDVQNTIAAIKGRMGYIPTEAEAQQKGLTDKATAAYDKDIKNIESKYDAEKNAFLKGGAIEDRYTNFNEVNDNIEKTLLEAGKHRAENLYTGMPTDEQINEIAQKAGNDFATTKQILEGRGFEALEMQGEFKDKSEQPFQRTFDDLEVQRNRAITDAETSHTRTQTALNEQITDVKTQMERNIAVGEKQGALSGAVRSSGYMQGLDNILKDATKNMDRLELRKDWDTEDTALLKGRVSEEFNKNMTRTKQDLETTMNQIKTQNGAALSKYLNEYAPSSSELTRKLDELDEKFAVEGQQAFNMYLSNLRGITDTMTYDTEKVMQLQKMKQDLQQTSINTLLKDNGAALTGITYNDLSTMLKTGDISSTDYTAMTGYMKTLGMTSLQSMGTPTPQDFKLYNQMLDQGSSPSQAISMITSQNPGRFSSSTVKGGSDWKLDDNTGLYMRTNAVGQPERREGPGSTLQGSTPEYNSVPETTIQAGMSTLLTSNQLTNQKAQCGEGVNDWLQSIGVSNKNLFLDPIDVKKTVMNSQQAKVGSIIVFDPTGTERGNKQQEKYGFVAGHVGIVTAVDTNDNPTRMADWNRDGTKSYQESAISEGMKKSIAGYFDPTKQGTTSTINNNKKQTALALISKGGITKTEQAKIAKQAVREGRSDEFNEALKQGAEVDLSPSQIDRYYKERGIFNGDPVVKGFEEGLVQFQSLAYALGDQSGPGDMAGVFSFMKTLDPSSVVREAEFEAAANSAGVGARVSNIYNSISKGKLLTPDQAETFKKVAKKFIEAKGESYNRLYKNMANNYKQFGIPDSLLPINATEQLNTFLKSPGFTKPVSGENTGADTITGRGL